MTNPIVKKFREIFSTPTVGKADYIQKMTLFESSFADNASESKHLNNVVDGLNLLRISEKFENQKKKTVQRREQQKQRQQQKKDMLNKRLSKRVNKTSQIFVK